MKVDSCGGTPRRIVTGQVSRKTGTIESYHTAFWSSAAFFAAGAIICGLLLPAGVPDKDPDAGPVLVH